jgi:hypothetical protein
VYGTRLEAWIDAAAFELEGRHPGRGVGLGSAANAGDEVEWQEPVR